MIVEVILVIKVTIDAKSKREEIMLEKTREFLKKFWEALFGNMDKKKIKKINAAFGSFLLLALTSLTNPLRTIIGTGIWSDYFLLVWLGFVGFLSVFIVSFFGTDKTAITSISSALTDEGIDIKALLELQENAKKILENLEAIAEGKLEAEDTEETGNG